MKAQLDVEVIQQKIYYLRGQKVMLDRDLAVLYGVPTYRLNEQVKRNKKRFPEDFMFQLTWSETAVLNPRSQIAILEKGQNVKYRPYVFTEQGVAMLSSVLSSDRAIEVNIQIIRVFTRLRAMMASHKDLARKIEDLERKFVEHDEKFVLVFEAIRRLMREEEKPRAPFGFHSTDKG